HVLSVRSARKNGCGLAGRTFLNRPGALMSNLILGKFALENFYYSTLPASNLVLSQRGRLR
ncbi:MAG: hypothetical protein KC588_15205, partial [Nitrospira sp.]|nr:hypothetical protein [Nitrospira sp.]